MGTTKIEWTDKSWNPITGCTKISPGCANCYAARMSKRLAGRCGYPANDPFRVTVHKDKMDEPLRWRKPCRVFVCSMGDLFHDDVPDTIIASVFAVMASARRHMFQLLTKRPARLRAFMRGWLRDGRRIEPLANIWLGVTAEDQQRADERIPDLLATPAAVRFVSVEPMLGLVDLTKWILRNDSAADGAATPSGRLQWVICGAETGPGARPMDNQWAADLCRQCQEADVPFFFKKHSDGSRRLMGREWNQMPGQDNH
jgi:protein gp37